MGFGFKETDKSGFCVCGKKKKTRIKIIKTTDANKIKIERHPNSAITKLPAVGASIGDAPRIKISNEITEALLSGGKKSRTIAIAATEPTQPLKACKNRITNNSFIEFDVLHNTVTIMYKTRPM